MALEPKFSIYKRLHHPRAPISKRYPNATKNDVLDNLFFIGKEEKLISKHWHV
jgi:hypothetical protein